MDGALVDCRLVEVYRQQQVQRRVGWVMVVIPPIATCATDGALVDCRLVEENRQQQVQRRCGWVMVVIHQSQSARWMGHSSIVGWWRRTGNSRCKGALAG